MHPEQPSPRTSNAHVDAVVIGGSAAGLAAALQLGRMRRTVVVVDDGKPRNAPAAHMHGYLGHDGLPPAELVAIARREVAAYGVRVLDGRVLAVDGSIERGFTVAIEGDDPVNARRVVLATGLADQLPDIPGVRDGWGSHVIHCPYCHGWEVRDQRIVVIDTNGVGAHQALLFRGLTADLTLVVHAGDGPADHELERLAALDVRVRHASVASVEHGRVRLDDGGVIDADAVVVGPRMVPNLHAVTGLGIVAIPHASGFADVIETSPTGETTVRGVYAAGNVADPSHQVLQAAARGAQVGAFVNMSLAEADADAAVRSRADAARWDERYGGAGDQMWSGNPNGSLVVELAASTPGRLLDIGCGEGADAIWLAERGWDVTAVDISSVAIERARAAAHHRGATVEWRCADVLVTPPDEEHYDVVTLQYPALLREAGAGPIRRLLAAVRPGGIFLLVGHDLDAEHHHRHASQFVGVDELRGALAGWFTIEVDEIRPRPSPPAGAHHVDDVVLRARRTG